jgi:hypothetical protein
MFNISNQLKEIRSSIVGIGLVVVTAALGLIWISIGLYAFLSAKLGPVWGPILLGTFFLLPLLGAAVARLFADKPVPAQPQAMAGQTDDAILGIAKLTENLSGQSPFVATSVAILAGVIAARFPSLLTLFLQLANAWVADLKLRAARAEQPKTDEPLP